MTEYDFEQLVLVADELNDLLLKAINTKQFNDDWVRFFEDTAQGCRNIHYGFYDDKEFDDCFTE